MRIRNSALTELAFTPRRYALVAFNHLPHLDSATGDLRLPLGGKLVPGCIACLVSIQACDHTVQQSHTVGCRKAQDLSFKLLDRHGHDLIPAVGTQGR
jgi:hypothetical protein